MPRGTTLANLRKSLKAQVGDYSGTNAARDAELNQLLADKQLQLTLEKDWSFLQRRWDVVVAPGARYVNYPTTDITGESCTINFDELQLVEIHWNNQFYRLQYGIGADQYNLLDPALGQTADPIQRWREEANIDETSGANQFEVWPVPMSAGQTVRFTGERNLNPLVADSDTADLDDVLIVLGCAVDILTRTKQPDAQVKSTQFGRRLHQLGSANQTQDKKRIMGAGREGSDSGTPSGIKLVAIH